MSENSLTLRDGTLVDPSVEMYPRNEAGRLGPMLGVVGQLVPALECFKTVVIERNNDERVIAAIKIMLDEARRQELEFEYEGIIDAFQLYVDHGDSHSLLDTRSLCTAAAPKFAAAFETTVESFNAYTSKFWPKSSVDSALAKLISAADAYLIILSIGFHAQTKLTPETAPKDRVVIKKIESAIKFLEERLEFLLLPGGRVQRSPMISLIITGNQDRFLYYYPYCKGYAGEAGVVKMIAAANEKKRDENGRWQGFKVDDELHSYSYYALADALIEILSRFKKLLDIRLSFNASDPASMELPILGQLLKLKKRDFWIYRVGIYDFAQ